MFLYLFKQLSRSSPFIPSFPYIMVLRQTTSHILLYISLKTQSVYVFITEIIWRTFDVIIDDPYLT